MLCGWEGNRRPGEKKWQPTAGWMTCGLTACTPGSVPGPTLVNGYGKPLPFIVLLICVKLIATEWSQIWPGDYVDETMMENSGMSAECADWNQLGQLAKSRLTIQHIRDVVTLCYTNLYLPIPLVLIIKLTECLVIPSGKCYFFLSFKGTNQPGLWSPQCRGGVCQLIVQREIPMMSSVNYK